MSRRFEPIAIVSRSCVLPGTLDPGALWRAVADGRDLVGRVPDGRWGIAGERVLAERGVRAAGSPGASGDHTWTDRGGYVSGFDSIFEPDGFRLPAESIAGLDPLFHWLLHTGREALRDAGLADPKEARLGRTGAVVGNLSFPAAGTHRFADAVWRGDGASEDSGGDPRNRFISGLPAHLLAQALGLGGPAFALDAACASSLYALKYACDRLHDRRADVMLAGAVSCCDDLFIHVGFAALEALSPSGRSRPFHRRADGLLPAEGAAFVVLERLADAVAEGREILGVIRGIGLSNDGRGRGLLVPSPDGQERALRQAYEAAGLHPADVSLVECHATGTRVGDATELESLGRVYEGLEGIPVGSLKSNLGHLITAAGLAGLLKVLAAMEAGVRPATLHADDPNPAFEGSPFRLLTEAEPWPDDRPRVAALSAFGFGGNNAHLLVEEPPAHPAELSGGRRDPSPKSMTVTSQPQSSSTERRGRNIEGENSEQASTSVEAVVEHRAQMHSAGSLHGLARSRPPKVAIVGMAVTAAGSPDGGRDDLESFARTVLAGESRIEEGDDGSPTAPVSSFELPLQGLSFPPRDLDQTLPQQSLLLRVAQRAVDTVRGELPAERTAVLAGMGCDAEVARWGVRWRLAEEGLAGEELRRVRDGVVPELRAEGVVGTMPNMVANRINRQLDFGGASASLSAEERSGVVALELAARALAAGEIDAALVAASDLSCEPVHEAAARALLPESRHLPGDAAVALVVKRLEDARGDGDRILAVLGDGTSESSEPDLRFVLDPEPGSVSLAPLVGHAHAASGLLHVAAAVVACHHRALSPPAPWLASGTRRATVTIEALGGQSSTVGVAEDREAAPGSLAPAGGFPQVFLVSGEGRAEVLERLRAGRWDPPGEPSASGPARLALVAADRRQLGERRDEAVRLLARNEGPVTGSGVFYRDRPLAGELAFVFPGAAAAYPGMGRELLLALPELLDRLGRRMSDQAAAAGWVYDPERSRGPLTPLDKLWGSSFLCQAHAELSRGLLGLRPEATLGYSSGESNALLALGVWNDLDELHRDTRDGGLFDVELGGEMRAVNRAWSGAGRWSSWLLRSPAERVREAAAGELRVHLTHVNSPGEVVIGGEEEGCRRLIGRLGVDAVPLDFDLAVHCPEVSEVAEAWLELHRRPTRELEDVRFYTCDGVRSFRPNREEAARAILGQALTTVDFPALVGRAWDDGVRIFVEHGPRDLLSGWIRDTLRQRGVGDDEYLAVAFDRAGSCAVERAALAVAELLAAGVDLDHSAFSGRWAVEAEEEAAGPSLTLAAHWPPVRLEVEPPALAELLTAETVETEAGPAQVMAPAPALPPVLGEAEPYSERLPVVVPTASPETVPEPVAVPVAASAPVARASAPPSPPERRPTTIPPAAAAELHARVVAAQQQFLRGQVEVHQRFLDWRRREQERLLGMVGGSPAAVPPDVSVGQALPYKRSVAEAVSAPPVPRPLTPPAPLSQPPSAPSQGEGGVRHEELKELPGPKWSRADLEVLARGRISSVFGPLFARQDGYERQVRMPAPPFLFADRVTGLDAEAGSMGTGTIWTETDVTEDSWFLDRRHMAPGLMIEAGQADLLLISWLGIDFHNRGERVYRLLGCELTYRGSLPRPGDTLCYEIHVDGHAREGEVRLFFFHYDCVLKDTGETRLEVRSGQAGFFTDEELAESAGVLWDAAEAEPVGDRLDPPAVPCVHHSFTREQLVAASEGRVFECLGPGFELAASHTLTPTIQGGRMLLLDRVTDFDPAGSPWGRGYLRAVADITPDAWFFDGHFHNDPCMPGTLMFEGCLQAMAFYLMALGYTLERDGWRFEPVPDEAYRMRCRGQVDPRSRELVYEVFVHEVVAGPIPTLWADLLCTVDGLKAFHAERVGLRLVPDWPLETCPDLAASVMHVAPGQEPRMVEASRGHRARGPACRSGDTERSKAISLGEQLPHLKASIEHQGGRLRPQMHPAGNRSRSSATSVDGFTFDHDSLLACAWGRPSRAFGEMYRPFDGPRTVPRLPGPPYHFMSRVVAIDGAMGVFRHGAAIEVEYDVPPEAWYFGENGCPTMPFAVLMEAGLQPCGWLASFVGSALTSDVDLKFRNLDGTGTLHAEVDPESGILTSRVRLTATSASAGVIIVRFTVEMECRGAPVFDMETAFGFFPAAAMEQQVGLPANEEERRRLEQPRDFLVDLADRPERYCGSPPQPPGGRDGRDLRLAGPKLLMLDRVTGYWPEEGRAGLGRLRAEKDVDPGEWFFKAHFFQDPVQPGSLGIEAMVQLLQFYMIHRGLGDDVPRPRFEPIAAGHALTWKYRGQVMPTDGVITTELEVLEVGRDDRGVYALADAWLWIDGKRIYAATGLGMRIVEGTERDLAEVPPPSQEVLDPERDSWLADHCPTWTFPALPMMSVVERLAAAARAARPDLEVVAVEDVAMRRWIAFDQGPVRLRAEVVETAREGDRWVLDLELRTATAGAELTVAARGKVILASAYPPPPAIMEPLDEAEPVADPYEAGVLFHGPAFQLLRELRLGERGSTAVLDAGAGGAPRGTLHQALLDAATHGIPHDDLRRWLPEAPADVAAYPRRLVAARFFGPTPKSGEVRAEARLVKPSTTLPTFSVQLVAGGVPWAELLLEEVFLPKGPLGTAPPGDRRAFLHDRRAIPGLGLSRRVAEPGGAEMTRLKAAEVGASDWLPGTVARVYGVAADADRRALTREVAIRDHVARRAAVHPGRMALESTDGGDEVVAVPEQMPLNRFPVRVAEEGGEVAVSDAGPGRLDLVPVADYWRRLLGVGPWPVEDLFLGLVERFVRRVIVADPDAWKAQHDRPMLFLGNHQVMIESLLFSVVAGALGGLPVMTLAKADHRESWVGDLIGHSFAYPGVEDPGVITFFERDDLASGPAVVDYLGGILKRGDRSVMIHCEGTRTFTCRQPVRALSGAFLDAAMAARAAVVPVRFAGGLPVEPLPELIEFPFGCGRQDFWIGRPILVGELAELDYGSRRETVMAAINDLGPSADEEVPLPPDPEFGAAVEEWHFETGALPAHALIYRVLEAIPEPSPAVRKLREAAASGRLVVADDPPGRWLKGLAKRLFGERGPEVEVAG